MSLHNIAEQAPLTCRSSLRNRVLLELFSEPDIFGFQWASTNVYNGVTYPALPDLYGPTMNVSPSLRHPFQRLDMVTMYKSEAAAVPALVSAR